MTRRRSARGTEVLDSRSDTPETGVTTFRAHVFHTGESLAGIAAAYALTARQIAMANGIDPNDVVPDGCRLVIPLAQSGPGAGPTHGRRRTDRSG
jgi:LysM repeat protein